MDHKVGRRGPEVAEKLKPETKSDPQVIKMACHCVECEEDFIFEYHVEAHRKPLVCPRGHENAYEVAAIDAFLRRLLNETGGGGNCEKA